MVDLVRRHPGVFIVAAAAIGLVAVGGFHRSTGQGETGAADVSGRTEAGLETDGGGGSGAGGVETGEDGPDLGDAGDNRRGGAAPGSGEAAGPGDTMASNAGSGASASTTSAPVPPDVAHPRPDINLDRAPDRSDVADVARWWAAVYTAYVGSEPGADLADRLQDQTSDGLYDELVSLPAPASYGPVLEVEGVSAGGPFVQEHQDPETERTVRVSVETPGALVIYNISLVEVAGGWQVGGLDIL